MSTTAERMGVAGDVLPERVLSAINAAELAGPAGLTRDEKLALAWALVDQASSLRTTREAQRAMAAIEDLYDAEEEAQ